MADEKTILEIGAVVDLGNFLPSMDKLVSTTTTSTNAMSASFKNLGASTTAAMTSVVASVGEVARVGTVAAATASEVESGSVKMAGSFTGLASTVRGATASIIGNLSEVGAKISETAERSRLGVGTMETAFSGLSSLLGAGIAVGFAAHFLDESARVIIELDHLKTETGLTIETLAGLRAVAQQNSVPFESLQTALIRMQRAQLLAVEGNKQMRQHFLELGLTLHDLQSMDPAHLFFALADGMQKVPQYQVAVTAGMTIMGRGAYTLIPLLREHGSALEGLTAAAGRNSGITDKAAEAAMQWHKQTTQLVQTLQSYLIPILELINPLITIISATIKALLTPLVDVTLATLKWWRVLYDLASFNWKDLALNSKRALDETTRVFKDSTVGIIDDWGNMVREMSSAPPKTIFEKAKEDLDSLFGKKSDLSEFTDVLTKGGGKDALSKMREELDQLRDAQTGYYELGKAKEADFWRIKLETAKAGTALYRSIYHELVTAERAARNESLSDEVTGVEQKVQAERTGSIERVVILQEELAHLREVHAEKTSEYKRLQSGLTTAQRELTAASEREFAQNVQNELALTKSAAEQMTIIRHAQLQSELLGFNTEGESFKQLKEDELKAERLFIEEQRAIQAIDADTARSHEQSKLEIRRAAAQTQANIGLISQAQRIATERKIVDEEIELERQALQEKLALYKQDPVEYERILKQIEALQDKHAKLMAQLDNQQLTQRLAGWTKFNQEFSSGFAQAVGRMVETGKGFGQILAQTWNNILSGFAQALTKMVTEWVLKHTLMAAVSKLFATQEVVTTVTAEGAKTAAHVAGESAQTAASATGAAARSNIGLLADLKSIGSAAATAAAHAFKWVMEVVPFPFNLALAPAAAAGAFAAVAAYKGIAAAAGGGLIQGAGTGTSDSILARLSHGEYVVKAAAVNRVGVGFLDSVNEGRGFSAGGSVGNAASSSIAEASSASAGGGDSPGISKIAGAINGNMMRVEIVKQDAKASAQQALFGGLFGRIFGHLFDLIGLAEGGHVVGPGSSTSDSIPARLSAGEYVVKASAVGRVGTKFLDGLNSGYSFGFAGGGLVGIPLSLQNVAATGGFNTANSSSNTTHNHRTVSVGSPRVQVTVNGDSGGMKDLHNQVVKTIKRAVRNGELALNDF